MEHVCEYLKYQDRKIELVHEGTAYQRYALMGADGHVLLQVVMFCPYCGEDFRAECLWQIPGRPQENGILARAQRAGQEAKRKKERPMKKFKKVVQKLTTKTELILVTTRMGGRAYLRNEGKRRWWRLVEGTAPRRVGYDPVQVHGRTMRHGLKTLTWGTLGHLEAALRQLDVGTGLYAILDRLENLGKEASETGLNGSGPKVEVEARS